MKSVTKMNTHTIFFEPEGTVHVFEPTLFRFMSSVTEIAPLSGRGIRETITEPSTRDLATG
jgi:hypothetical protein